jgi:hypothetical protein
VKAAAYARVKAGEHRGCVYVIESADGAFVKVGFTTNLKLRVKTLAAAQRPVSSDVILRGWMPGSVYKERDIHRLLASHRANGEWFHNCEDLRQLIAGLDLQPGFPPPIVEPDPVPVCTGFPKGFPSPVPDDIEIASQMPANRQQEIIEIRDARLRVLASLCRMDKRPNRRAVRAMELMIAADACVPGTMERYLRGRKQS